MSDDPGRVPRIETTLPTRHTSRMRRFLPWQLVRFVLINVRMLRMIALSHPHRR